MNNRDSKIGTSTLIRLPYHRIDIWLSAMLITLASLVFTAFPVIAKEVVADPTRPSSFHSVSTVAKPKYRLESVMVGKGRKIAIINGLSFVVGDRTALGKIVSISKNSVEIRGNKRIVLKLLGQNVKQISR